MLSYGIQIILAAAAYKLLQFDCYHSTDFEVHRNWLAVTHNVKVSNWYNEATNKWTLDYPPLFAYFEWVLSQIGSKIDQQMVKLSADAYSSVATVYFQRSSVLLSELVLLCTICRLFLKLYGSVGSKAQVPYMVAISMFAFNFGLFVVDHIHFQYNGFLFGILFLSILGVFQGRYLWSGFWFAVLLNLKHLFLYIAPVYFAFLLLNYCITKKKKKTRFMFSRFVTLGATVLAVFVVSFGPFIYWGKLSDVLSRLFPFHRGLCHSYWAPNFWSLYNVADKAISLSGLFSHKCYQQTPDFRENKVSMTSGLTGNYEHMCLPTIRPLHTAFFTAVFTIPSIVFCKSQKAKLDSTDAGFLLLRSIVAAAWASFLFGWHVHEKAILMVTLPLTFLAVSSRKLRALAFYVNTIAHFSLLPLIFTPDEQPMVLSTYFLYTVAQYSLLGRSTKPVPRGLLSCLWPRLVFLGRVHLLGLLPLLLVERQVLPRAFPCLEFFPLMMVSVYCAVGLLSGFFVYVWINAVWMAEEWEAQRRDESELVVVEEENSSDTESATRKKND